jgi:parallel beta-helix repeat protein
VLESDDNTVVRNRVVDASGVGIVLTEREDDGSDGNRIARNSIARGRFAGILVTGPSSSNTLSENVASRNGTDGIRVRTAGNMLERNTANRNRRRGIEAVAGTVDGGGHRTTGNGLSPQCMGVSC